MFKSKTPATDIKTETKLLLPCGCSHNCVILAIDRYNLSNSEYGPEWREDEPEWWFEFYSRVHEKASFGYRLKKAWAVLMGKDYYLDSLILSDQEIQKLRDFIDTNK